MLRRAGAEARRVDLVAKVPPATNAGRYPKTDFYVDLEAGEVTCPAGEVTTAATPGRDHKGRPGRCSASTPPSVPPAPCEPIAPRRRAGGPSLSVSTTSAWPPLGPPNTTPRS